MPKSSWTHQGRRRSSCEVIPWPRTAANAGGLAHGRKTGVGDGRCLFNTDAMQQILLSVSGLEFLL